MNMILEKAGEDLQRDPRVELLSVARDVPHTDGQGQGCTVAGTGELQTSGSSAENVKTQFPWSRGVLVIKVTDLKTHLP